MTRLVIPIVWALAMFATRFVNPLVVILITAVTLAVVVVWREPEKSRALLHVTSKTAALGVVAAVVMLVVTYAGVPVLARSFPSIGTGAIAIYARFLSHRNVWLLVAAVVPVVVAEELLWRGVMQGPRGRWGAIASPAIYAIAHAPAGSVLLVVVAFVCGVYWSALRAISGSLVPSLCAHLAWDVALILFPLVLA